MFILSGAAKGLNDRVTMLRLGGNLLFLGSLFCEAAVTVTGRPMTPKYRPHVLIGAMIIAGFVGAGTVNSLTIASMDFSTISLRGWLSVAYLAVFCSVFAYTFWYRVIQHVPVSIVALSLFVQPIVGAFLGKVILGETLDAQMMAGALMICVSLIIWQIRLNKKSEARERMQEQSQ